MEGIRPSAGRFEQVPLSMWYGTRSSRASGTGTIRQDVRLPLALTGCEG